MLRGEGKQLEKHFKLLIFDWVTGEKYKKMNFS
jgi:hypothetical protein